MNEKIGIIIVTYNPESELLRIINSLENYITVIIDNGSTESETKSSLRKQSFQKKNINFIELEENKGLGFAQNIGISVLEKKNVEFVVLFDQDTMFETVFLENLVSTFYKTESTFPQLGVLVPVYYDKKRLKLADFTVKTKKKYIKKQVNQHFLEIAFANASGMIFRIDLIKKVGNMREDFFIDQIDIEFCVRVNHNGYKIVATDYLQITHTVGEGKLIKIGGMSIQHSNHNENRRYYIARNSIIMTKLYSTDKMFISLIRKRLFKTIIICLLEKDRFNKIKYIIRGIKDGFDYNNS